MKRRLLGTMLAAPGVVLGLASACGGDEFAGGDDVEQEGGGPGQGPAPQGGSAAAGEPATAGESGSVSQGGKAGASAGTSGSAGTPTRRPWAAAGDPASPRSSIALARAMPRALRRPRRRVIRPVIRPNFARGDAGQTGIDKSGGWGPENCHPTRQRLLPGRVPAGKRAVFPSFSPWHRTCPSCNRCGWNSIRTQGV